MVKASERVDSYTGDDYTQVSFVPDFKRFNMTHLESDTIELFKKRVWDLSGVMNKKVGIFYNGTRISISSFRDYCGLYLPEMTRAESLTDLKTAYLSQGRWEVLAGASDGEFHQISFVNSICTTQGGTHVDYLVNQVTAGLIEEAQKRCKKVKIKPHFIKANMFIMANCQIENPAFSSQTKEQLTSKVAEFGSTVELGEKFFKEMFKTGIIDQIIYAAQSREEQLMAKKLKGGKKSRLLGINKLEDANKAGTKDSQKCTLILTEGDSAKAFAMHGLEVVGRDHFGVYPLRGKFLNVREAANQTILNNHEVSQIIEIMGLSVGKKYNGDYSTLRYGSIMIMTDQDADGSHIKGLIINFIHHFWPDLIRSNSFLKEFVTPLLKASKGKQVLPFFTNNDFKAWADQRGDDLKNWHIKYYKGLGTSDDKEAKEYFQNILVHEIKFNYLNSEDDEAIDLGFNKKKADDRKDWLARFDMDIFVDHNVKVLRYYDFINKELIHFSMANNQRAIPSLCDGLKSGQRKILFSAFKRNMIKEVKVAQFSGYVAEQSGYHHGEQNLADTIIGMAQNFVGSNNINLLMPNGQFGSRSQGGKDAASGRYLHTALSKLTRLIYMEADDHILTYLDDDGKLVEPMWYLPILPMALVNGSDGIGTGWSTNIPNYNPVALAENIQERLNGRPFKRLDPWYKGYNGEIYLNEGKDKSYICKGVFEYDEDHNLLQITELPIKKWTRDYKTGIEEMMQEKDKHIIKIEDMTEYHTSRNVHFRLELCNDQSRLDDSEIEKVMKLSTTIPTTNMVLFDHKNHIKRYDTESDLLEEYFQVRLDFYGLRKLYQLSRIEREISTLENKMRFIQEVNEELIVLKKRNKRDIVQQLVKRKFTMRKHLPKIRSSLEDNILSKLQKAEEEQEGEEAQGGLDVEESTVNRDAKEFDYLLSMPLWNLTEEYIARMAREVEAKQGEKRALENTDVKDMWRQDLGAFLKEYQKYIEQERLEFDKEDKKGKKPPANEKPKKAKKKEAQTAQMTHEQPARKSQKPEEPPKKIKKEAPAQRPEAPKPKPEPVSTKQLDVSQLEEELKKSMLQHLLRDDGGESKARLLKIIAMTREQLEAMDQTFMTLEEKLRLKELRQPKKEALQKEEKPAQGGGGGSFAEYFKKPVEEKKREIPVVPDEDDSDDDIFMMKKKGSNRKMFDEDSN